MATEKPIERKSLEDDAPIVFYTFEYLSNSARFRTLLEDRFRKTGHTRRIDFRYWDCYHEIPDTDGDLYAYDACVMSALVDKGIIRSSLNWIRSMSSFMIWSAMKTMKFSGTAVISMKNLTFTIHI